MILNERKIKILEAIINDYICTAEPIGSRTIAKKYDLGISSATIRNEMSDLEEMGLIMQPHASSGRIPSDKGYRLYVDKLMRYRELTHEETQFLRQTVVDNINQIDYLMQETATAISILTNYTTIVTEPHFQKTSIKHIQLVPFDETSIVLVLVTESKTVKNQIVKLPKAPDYETLCNLSAILNKRLQGCGTADMNRSAFEDLLEQSGGADILLPVMEAIMAAIHTEDQVQVYTSGAKNILTYPEFSDLDKARTFFQALEEKEILITLLGSDSSENIQVVIGSEHHVESMKDCSIIRANYMSGGQSCGSIGIIGPTRMNYMQVGSILNGIVKNINRVLNALTGG